MRTAGKLPVNVWSVDCNRYVATPLFEVRCKAPNCGAKLHNADWLSYIVTFCDCDQCGYCALTVYESVGTDIFVPTLLDKMVENSGPVIVIVDAGGLACTFNVPKLRFHLILPKMCGPY